MGDEWTGEALRDAVRQCVYKALETLGHKNATDKSKLGKDLGYSKSSILSKLFPEIEKVLGALKPPLEIKISRGVEPDVKLTVGKLIDAIIKMAEKGE